MIGYGVCVRETTQGALGNMELLLIEEGKTVVEQVLGRRSQVRFGILSLRSPLDTSKWRE